MNSRCVSATDQYATLGQSTIDQSFADYEFFGVEHHNDVTLLTFIRATLCDADDKHEIRNALLDLLNDTTIKNLVVDFSLVQYCSNEVISDLLLVQRQLVERGGNLCLCCMQQFVMGKFRELHLEGRVFTVFDLQSEALQAFS